MSKSFVQYVTDLRKEVERKPALVQSMQRQFDQSDTVELLYEVVDAETVDAMLAEAKEFRKLLVGDPTDQK